MQATIDASGAQAMPVNIAVNLLDERASYNKLVQGLSIYNNSSQEQRAHMGTRIGDEIHALLSCPPASHAEVIESILMQRFFGTLRRLIHRSYRPRTGTSSSTQPVDNAMSSFISTPELLEAMLSHLPVCNVVSSMRVSRTFQHLIQTSPTLLSDLFLRPQKEPFETLILARDAEGRSKYRRKPIRQYRIATLCPLLHMDRQSHLTVEEGFESEFREVALIDPCAVYARSTSSLFTRAQPPEAVRTLEQSGL